MFVQQPDGFQLDKLVQLRHHNGHEGQADENVSGVDQLKERRVWNFHVTVSGGRDGINGEQGHVDCVPVGLRCKEESPTGQEAGIDQERC